MIGMTNERAIEIDRILEQLGFIIRWHAITTLLRYEVLVGIPTSWDRMSVQTAMDFVRERFGNPPYNYATNIDSQRMEFCAND